MTTQTIDRLQNMLKEMLNPVAYHNMTIGRLSQVNHKRVCVDDQVIELPDGIITETLSNPRTEYYQRRQRRVSSLPNYYGPMTSGLYY